jgi:hypothetical protein
MIKKEIFNPFHAEMLAHIFFISYFRSNINSVWEKLHMVSLNVIWQDTFLFTDSVTRQRYTKEEEQFQNDISRS